MSEENPKKAWDKNISPTGWYVATEIMRFIPNGSDPDDAKRRFLVWENLVIYQAETPEVAYQKAIEQGELNNGVCKGGRWKFEGLSDLLPIYDDFEDGAEIVWTKHPRWGVDRVRVNVREKHELQVFSNDPPLNDKQLLRIANKFSQIVQVEDEA